jgi:S1-C subfamily serine protease
VRYFDLPRETGVEVVSLDPVGPAGKAGVQTGDIVVGMNGQPVESVDDLHRLLSEVAVRDLTRLDVLRGTERKVLEVEIGEAAA